MSRREEEIRDPMDYVLDAKDILETLARNREKIDSIDFRLDQRLNIVKNGSQINLQNELTDLGSQINRPHF
jgi:hypothetical protein